MGEILMIGDLNHLQIQPIDGRQFILSYSIITCIKMVSLKCAVRQYGDEFVKPQSIIRKYYSKFE